MLARRVGEVTGLAGQRMQGGWAVSPWASW